MKGSNYMGREEVLTSLNQVFKEVFNDEELYVDDSTTAKDVSGWDSLVHLTLIASVEEKFNIEFRLGEINKFQNVGEMIDSIIKHLGN